MRTPSPTRSGVSLTPDTTAISPPGCQVAAVDAALVATQFGATHRPKSESGVHEASSPSVQTQAVLRLVQKAKTAVVGAMLGAGLLLGSPAVAQTGAPVDTCGTELVTPRVTAADTEAQVRALAEGVECAACALDERGDPDGAACLRTIAEAHAAGGAADTPLGAVVGTLNGDPDAQEKLRQMAHAGQVQVEPEGDGWKVSVRLFTGNDNAATLLDGEYRSDDGATANLGAELLATRENPDGTGRQFALDVGLEMLTERGGMQRTDLVDALLTYAVRSDVGDLWFDRETLSFTVGLESTGDFGGATLQDGWHALGEGTPLAGRRLGQGLQDTYAHDRQTSLLLGGRASGVKDFGWLDLSAGAEARVPVGPTGVGWVSSDISLRLGQDTGLFASGGVDARYQWTNGEALAFDGAPVDGEAVLVPRVRVGWQGEGWSMGLEWSRNELGTSPGLGGMDDDRVSFGITIGGGQRWR